MESRKSWLEISERGLRDNYRTLVDAACAGGRSTAVMAVVKAGAYGHGAELCAGVLSGAGAGWLGVTDAEEGHRVRLHLDRTHGSREGQPRILVMCGPMPEDAKTMEANALTPVVWTPEHMDWMAGAAGTSGTMDVHLEVDTGMSRQGVLPGEALERFLDGMCASPGLRLAGVLTHFASAEVAGSPLTEVQRRRFEGAMRQIAGRGLRPEWIHAGNSSTIDEGGSLPWLQQMAAEHGARAMVRSGLAMYGYCLPLEGGESVLRDRLRPVLTWKSRIAAIEDVPAGATVGYNGTYVAATKMRLALLPVGYADGLRRELSATSEKPGGWVMAGGRRAPIVGRISMNLTTVDVSAIAEAEVGDEVTMLGEGVTAEDHARLAGTIPYEIVCGLRALPRLVA